MKVFFTRIIILFLLSIATLAQGQDFMMQAWYWNYPKTIDGHCWADTLSAAADEISDAGITYISLPPLARTSSGSNSNGYDPRDLFDYGEYSGGATGFGTRAQVQEVITACSNYNVDVIADLVLNHRDGGEYENNPALYDYFVNYFDYASGDQPYPYDRYRVILPIGGASGNGAGHYYFKVKSRSAHTDFTGNEYSILVETNKLNDLGTSKFEHEPNGGGDCSQDGDTIHLGETINADNFDWGGCVVDEYLLILDAADYNASGDTIFITFGKRSSNYSDLYIYSLYSGYTSSDIASQLIYQTATDFSGMPSGRGDMDWTSFKPNSDRVTDLSGEKDGMYFYYDYDQYQQQTYDTLYNWAEWNWSTMGMKGLRMDAVKHYEPVFIADMFDYLHGEGIDPAMTIGEYYSDNTSFLNTWIDDVQGNMDAATLAAITPRVFDFSLRKNLRKACDDGTFDVRNIFVGSLHDVEGTNGENIVTFVNNHDFRGSSTYESLIQNEPMLAYAYILTNNKIGLPSIFYPDYFGYEDNGTTYYPSGANADPHGAEMKKIIEIHQLYIEGATTVTYLNKSGSGFANDCADNSKVITYQMSGSTSGKQVVIGINFSSAIQEFHQQLNLTGSLAVGSKLTDLMGNSTYDEADVKLVENGISNDIWMSIPARSYAIWVEGANNAVIPLRPSDLKIDTINEANVTLSWTDNSMNETGFKVRRKATGGSWVNVITTASDIESYVDNTISQDIEYQYQVKSLNDEDESETAKTVTGRSWVKWTGSTNRNWATASNWGSGSLLSSSSKVIISNEANDPQIGSAAECARMNIEAGAKLEITPTSSLTIIGILYNLAGTSGLLINSSAAGTATLLHETNNVDATVNTFIANSNNTMWTLVAPPVSGEIADVFLGEYLDYWNEPTEAWVDIVDETTPINIMQGYSSRKVADTAKYEGKIKAGQMSKALDYTSGVPDDYTGWNLLGNPYPSNIDWDLVTIPTNMESGISIWDSDGGDYFQYSKGGIGDIEARYVQVGQGYFVRAQASGVSFSLNDNTRTHAGNSGIDKNAKSPSSNLVNSLIFEVLKDNKGDKTFLDFKENTQWNYDLEMDVHKLFGYEHIPQVFSYFSLKENILAAINSVPFPSDTDTIPIGFRVNTNGLYDMNIYGLYSLPMYMQVYLYDRVSEDVYDLKVDSSLQFNYSNEDPEHRFDLFFNDITSIEIFSNNSDDIIIYSNQNRLFIQGSSDIGQSAISIFNMQGQKVAYSNNLHEFENGKSLFITEAYYLVLVNTAHHTYVEKVFIAKGN